MDGRDSRDKADNISDRYWQDFARSGKIKDYLRYALGWKDK